MSRKTFVKDEVKISYGNGRITSFSNDGNEIAIKNMSEAMYFYYDIIVLFGNKEVFRADAYDFPKVQDLHLDIDYMIDFDMNKAYLIENTEENGFHRIIKYNQIRVEDMDVEYFYKIERYDYSVKQSGEDMPKLWTEYIITIGIGERNKEGFSNRENYGKSIYVSNLSKEDLLRLKKTTLDFCEESIKIHNKCLEKI